MYIVNETISAVIQPTGQDHHIPFTPRLQAKAKIAANPTRNTKSNSVENINTLICFVPLKTLSDIIFSPENT